MSTFDLENNHMSYHEALDLATHIAKTLHTESWTADKILALATKIRTLDKPTSS